ncbi:MAG: hypothetical protein ACI9TY_001097 [Alphaproteobacteria bacterium]|jgi:hypothetical protein
MRLIKLILWPFRLFFSLTVEQKETIKKVNFKVKHEALYEKLTKEPCLEKQKLIAIERAEISHLSINLLSGMVCGFITSNAYVLKEADGTLKIICHACVLTLMENEGKTNKLDEGVILTKDDLVLFHLKTSYYKQVMGRKPRSFHSYPIPYNHLTPACDIQCSCK